MDHNLIVIIELLKELLSHLKDELGNGLRNRELDNQSVVNL